MIHDKRILLEKPVTVETQEHIRRQCIYTGMRVVHFDIDCETPYVVVEKKRQAINRPKKRFIP